MDFDALLLGLIQIAQPSGVRVTGQVSIGTVLNRQNGLIALGSGHWAFDMTLENRLGHYLWVRPKSINALGLTTGVTGQWHTGGGVVTQGR